MTKTAPVLSHIHASLRSLAVPIESLRADRGNAREHDDRNLAAIAESLRRFGWRSPVVVRRRGRLVLAGHGRLEAARRLGHTHVPALFTDDDKRQGTEFALADNRTAELATWNEKRLAEILAELRTEDAKLSAWWSADEIDHVLDQAAADAMGEEVVETIPTPPKKPATKLGDLWTLGRHRLLCGDSTKAEDVARLLGKARPFLMVTDPPYGVEYDAAWRNDAGLSATEQTGKVQNDDRASWAAAFRHFPGAVAYVWHAGCFASAVERSLVVLGFEIRAQIIWVKRRFAISRGHYHWRHEPCWYAVKKGSNAEWSGGRKQNTAWADIVDAFSPAQDDMFACKIDEKSVLAFDGSATTVWDIGNDTAAGGGHSTQKPIECMARPIRNHGTKDHDVYDPFLGSGTTLVACQQLDRRCFGIEIDPGYCDVVVARWEGLTGGKATKRER